MCVDFQTKKRYIQYQEKIMVAGRIQQIRKTVAAACVRAGRNPESVTLIAVGKTFPPEIICEAVNAGVVDIGENYVQEAIRVRDFLRDDRIRWHYIGHLQTNKVKYIADWVTMIHSVDNRRCAEEISKHGARLGRTIDVLVEVNTSDEATKYGVRPETAVEFVRSIATLPNIMVKGLMTIGPFTDTIKSSRASFRLLRSLRDEMNEQCATRIAITELSMGMTHDYLVAIDEGSTMIRIGTAIFGARIKKESTE